MYTLFERGGNYYLVSQNSLDYWDYLCCYPEIAHGTKKELEKLMEEMGVEVAKGEGELIRP